MIQWSMRSVLLSLLALVSLNLACEQAGEAEVRLPPTAPGTLDPDVARLLTTRSQAVTASPASAGAWMNLGMAFEANGMAERASACYQEVLNLSPDTAKAWYRRGMCQQALGLPEDARQSFERTSALAPSHVASRWRLGELLLEAGELPPARLAFERALELDARDLAASLGLARTLLQQETPRVALDWITRKEARGPASPLWAHLRRSAERALGRPTTGPSLTPAPPPHLSDPWTEEVASSWVGLAAALARAKVALDAERPTEALRLLAPMMGRTERGSALLTTHGVALVRSGRLQDGESELRQALLESPGSSDTHAYLADALHRQRRPLEAEQSARRARELNPRSSLAQQVLGVVLRSRGQRDAALSALTRSVALAPDRVEARRLLGSIQFELGLHADSAASFAVALASSPDDDVAWLGLAMASIELADWEQAESALATAARLAPERGRQLAAVRSRLARARTADGPR